MTSKIILTRDQFPIVHIKGNVIGHSDNLNVFKENNLIDRLNDLQNKIFLGFNNIIGITQENIFHNIHIDDNKIIFHKYNENSIIANDNPWLIDISNEMTLINYNNFINYTDNLQNQNSINLYDYFYKENYQDIFDKHNIIFNPSRLVYVLKRISKYDPLLVNVISNNGQILYLQYGTSYQLDNTFIYFNNIDSLKESLQIDIYFDIYYDNDYYSCTNKKWIKQYLLLESDVLLTQSILINYLSPTNPIIFPPPPDYCCPKKEIHNPAHTNYKIGQMASKKIQKYQQMQFSRNSFSIQLIEFNFTNRCAPKSVEQNINVSITQNNSNKCRHAPKNKF